MGADWNLIAMTEPLDSQPAPHRQPPKPQLRADLMSASPEYDTIELPANTTIIITQPLEITHSVNIIGNNATLLFDQGNTAAWPASRFGCDLRRHFTIPTTYNSSSKTSQSSST